MKSELKQYKVTIYGEQYSLISDESQTHVEAAAHYVNERMIAIAEKSNVDEKRMLAFVALQLSSDIIRLRDEIAKNKLDQTNFLHSLEKVIDSLGS